MSEVAVADDEQFNWLADDPEESKDKGALVRSAQPWRVLVVDDEPDVLHVTTLALRGIQFRGRPLQLFYAHSGAEAFQLLQQHKDIAVILLDVVMETEDAGLVLTRRVREELDNPLVRIILRTGQPGMAPEQEVIVDYDINDYKAKSELTSRQLFTSVVASLRAYDTLLSLERSRLGLEKVLDASGQLFQLRSLQDFASGLLHQVGAILGLGSGGLLLVRSQQTGELSVVAGTGKFEDCQVDLIDRLSPDAVQTVQGSLQQHAHHVDADGMVIHVLSDPKDQYVIYATPSENLTEQELKLLKLFCDRISTAVENLALFESLRRTQTATVVALADLAEFRDDTTGEHVLRVHRVTDAIMAELKRAGAYPEELSSQLLEYGGLAAVLHDVGKVSTPDRILHKPGSLEPDEMHIMRQHASAGERILAKAQEMQGGISYLTFARDIAGGHHEHWDGQGYPLGLAGHAIPLVARIVAVADVFDALTHDRPYKKAWPIDEAMRFIAERRGRQFDPLVVDAMESVVEQTPAEFWG
ncbi:MAG: DUF3369 domain-containing protein [Curvibacter sp.]|nr:DUF3369 domain-containing protein [Curvibacter sp.]